MSAPDPPAAEPAGTTAERLRVVERRRALDPSALLGVLIGLLLAVLGTVAVVRAGLGAPLGEPTVEVIGFRHSAAIGLLELVAGLLLVVAGASRRRGLLGAVGVIVALGGVATAVAGGGLRADLGMSRPTGWLVALLGVAAVIAATLRSEYRSERQLERPA